MIRLLCVEWDVKPYTLALSSSSYWRVVEVGDVHLGLSPLLLVVDPRLQRYYYYYYYYFTLGINDPEGFWKKIK